jgi:putative hydrolase of the HAD superfamily
MATAGVQSTLVVPQAIGFDLGNTLVEYPGVPLSWETLYPAALADAAAACGQVLAEDGLATAVATLRRFNTRLYPREHEVSSQVIFAEILAKWGLPENRTDAAAQAFFAHFNRTAVLFPDVLPALSALRERGLRLGILTDLPYGMDSALAVAQIAPIRHLIDSVVTSTGIGFRKPSPVGYLRMCQELNVLPARTWFVGDEPKDCAGAVRAGLHPILLSRSRCGESAVEAQVPGSARPPDQAWLEIESLCALLDLLPGR